MYFHSNFQRVLENYKNIKVQKIVLESQRKQAKKNISMV